MTAEPQSFVCPRCGARSFHPIDIAERYCGRCHDWTDEEANTWRALEMYAAGWLHDILLRSAEITEVSPAQQLPPTAAPAVHVRFALAGLGGRWRVTVERDPDRADQQAISVPQDPATRGMR